MAGEGRQFKFPSAAKTKYFFTHLLNNLIIRGPKCWVKQIMHIIERQREQILSKHLTKCFREKIKGLPDYRIIRITNHQLNMKNELNRVSWFSRNSTINLFLLKPHSWLILDTRVKYTSAEIFRLLHRCDCDSPDEHATNIVPRIIYLFERKCFIWERYTADAEARGKKTRVRKKNEKYHGKNGNKKTG